MGTGCHISSFTVISRQSMQPHPIWCTTKLAPMVFHFAIIYRQTNPSQCTFLHRPHISSTWSCYDVKHLWRQVTRHWNYTQIKLKRYGCFTNIPINSIYMCNLYMPSYRVSSLVSYPACSTTPGRSGEWPLPNINKIQPWIGDHCLQTFITC